jgi:hypothetical protein
MTDGMEESNVPEVPPAEEPNSVETEAEGGAAHLPPTEVVPNSAR